MSAPPNPATIHLHIDRLVLRGVAASRQGELVDALRHELQAHLATPGVASELGATRNIASLRGAQPVAVRSPDGTGLGQAFAGGLVAELKR